MVQPSKRHAAIAGRPALLELMGDRGRSNRTAAIREGAARPPPRPHRRWRVPRQHHPRPCHAVAPAGLRMALDRARFRRGFPQGAAVRRRSSRRAVPGDRRRIRRQRGQDRRQAVADRRPLQADRAMAAAGGKRRAGAARRFTARHVEADRRAARGPRLAAGRRRRRRSKGLPSLGQGGEKGVGSPTRTCANTSTLSLGPRCVQRASRDPSH
jgi:hypothetical protein